MKEELDALHKTGTWDLVDLPFGKFVIGCKWIYKIKTRSDGTVDRYKAPLVAKGFTQEYEIDYEETFAHVLDFLMLGLLLLFLRLANGHSFIWMPKMLFLMVNSQRKAILSFLLVTLTLQGSLTEYVDYGRHFMILNKLLEHGLQSSVLLSLSMVF